MGPGRRRGVPMGPHPPDSRQRPPGDRHALGQGRRRERILRRGGVQRIERVRDGDAPGRGDAAEGRGGHGFAHRCRHDPLPRRDRRRPALRARQGNRLRRKDHGTAPRRGAEHDRGLVQGGAGQFHRRRVGQRTGAGKGADGRPQPAARADGVLLFRRGRGGREPAADVAMGPSRRTSTRKAIRDCT